MSRVLDYYGLIPDGNGMLKCPFHNDKTPSLQVYYKTETCYCFSSNCRTHGKSIDVIDFVMYREGISKHAAILKAQTLLNGEGANEEKSVFLARMFSYFQKAVNNSTPAQEYLQKRNLDHKKLSVGYNSGQFHHGSRKAESLLENCVKYGLLIDGGKKSRIGEPAYGVFGKNCICFPLKNSANEIVSLYFRSTKTQNSPPNSPPMEGQGEVKEGSGVVGKHYYLKNRVGLYPNYPKPGTKKLILTESIIDAASLLQNENIAREYEILALFGTNGLSEEHQKAIKNWVNSPSLRGQGELEIIFYLNGDEAGNKAVEKYASQLRNAYQNIKISKVEVPKNEDINSLLEGHEEGILVELLAKRVEINFSFSSEDKIEKTKSEVIENEAITKPKANTAIDFLREKNLLKKLNTLIGKSGIVGEENSRMLLFLIILSYRNKSPLHGLVQGSSGSGKTHLISRIADMMPPEDVLRFTRITESSLYNWGEFDLFEKVVIIEDLDGLKEDALYALREFISNQVLRSSVTIKDKKGNNKSRHKIVQGQFSSLSATTKGEVYEDNMSRSFLLAVDESKAQTQKIIAYQNRKNAGEIDPREQAKTLTFIQSMVRNLQHYEVINPYAPQLLLPDKVHKIRRLNEMYQAVIKQVTFLHQHQRKRTKANQLITEIEDIEQATEILFESIVLKVDELDGSLRQFFERLKKYVKGENQEFILREIRQELNVSKTQVFRYIQTLVELEYVKQIGGYANKGLRYKIAYWDNYQKIRGEIKDFLVLQIEKLKQENGTLRNTNGTPESVIKH
ncbi:MAG: CHC2 zinc finger domain-containing protein [Chitinophagales bacterium]|nr:toprim domain-containing protein [Bacteroidota bacterium]